MGIYAFKVMDYFRLVKKFQIHNRSYIYMIFIKMVNSIDFMTSKIQYVTICIIRLFEFSAEFQIPANCNFFSRKPYQGTKVALQHVWWELMFLKPSIDHVG